MKVEIPERPPSPKGCGVPLKKDLESELQKRVLKSPLKKHFEEVKSKS